MAKRDSVSDEEVVECYRRACLREPSYEDAAWVKERLGDQVTATRRSRELSQRAFPEPPTSSAFVPHQEGEYGYHVDLGPVTHRAEPCADTMLEFVDLLLGDRMRALLDDLGIPAGAVGLTSELRREGHVLRARQLVAQTVERVEETWIDFTPSDERRSPRREALEDVSGGPRILKAMHSCKACSAETATSSRKIEREMHGGRQDRRGGTIRGRHLTQLAHLGYVIKHGTSGRGSGWYLSSKGKKWVQKQTQTKS